MLLPVDLFYPSRLRLGVTDFINVYYNRWPPRQPSVDTESNLLEENLTLVTVWAALLHYTPRLAEEEDNKMVERWQKDADGILIFVSPWVDIFIVLCIKWNTHRLVYSPLLSLRSLP